MVHHVQSRAKNKHTKGKMPIYSALGIQNWPMAQPCHAILFTMFVFHQQQQFSSGFLFFLDTMINKYL